MTRLIDADALLEAFKNKGFHATNEWRLIEHILTNAPTVQREGWVSVEDRLPELKDDSVLAHFENGSIETVHIAELKAQINGLREALVGIIDNDGGDGSKCFDAQILHSSRMKAIKLLSKTPAQNLQSFENEVIEMVASAWTCDCDDCPDNIRALKATNE